MGDGLTRRVFLQRTAAIGLAMATGGALARQPSHTITPRIAVVGAGLAGLTCAYRLQQSGHHATVYEALPAIGTQASPGDPIDAGHTAVLHLARELGIKLDAVTQVVSRPPGDLALDLAPLWPALHRDASAAGYPTLYDRYTPRGWELDHMSVVDWLDENIPGGSQSPLGRLITATYQDCPDQSALTFIHGMGYKGQGRWPRSFGSADHQYQIRGGPSQINLSLAEKLASRIVTSACLTGIRRRPNGTFTLTFGGKTDVTVDKVVLALPFTALRSAVDLTHAGFSALKLTAIASLGMGTYSYYRVGQYTRFAGVEAEPEGGCHFAGEHTAYDYQGTLVGAVVSGERAADELHAALRTRSPSATLNS